MLCLSLSTVPVVQSEFRAAIDPPVECFRPGAQAPANARIVFEKSRAAVPRGPIGKITG